MYLEVTGSRLESSNPRLFWTLAQVGAGDQSQQVTVTLLRSRVVAEYQQLLGPGTLPVSARMVDCRDSTIHGE